MWVIPFIIVIMGIYDILFLGLFLVIISEIGIIICDYIIIDMISLYVLSLGLCLFFGFYDNIRDSFHIYDDFLSLIM